MALVLAWGLLAACSGAPDDTGNDGNLGPSVAPTVVLTAPAEGEGSYAGRFALAWEIDGLVLDDDIGGAPRDGHGHVHVYVDDTLVAHAAEGGAEVTGLRPGAHTLRVRLAANDHRELDASDAVEVEVRAPSVRVLAPADGAVLAASSTPLTLAIDGLEMAPSLQGPDVFGTGLFRVLVDGEPRDWSNDPATAAATGLTPGVHTVTVQLVTADGRPLEPAVEDELTLEVPVGARGVYWDRTAFTSVFDSATVPLALSTTAFTLYDRGLTRPPIDGEGHLHLFLDGAWLDATAEPTRILQNVAPGWHVLEARLVSNDGFELPILDRMWVEVASDRPDVVVGSPGPDWLLGPAFDLAFAVENFTLDADAVANGRHIGVARVTVDGVLYAETAASVVRLSGLLPGTRLLRVQLANADRTLIEPAVYAEFPVIVE